MSHAGPCCIYCRISDDREGLERGVVRQEEDGRALAAQLGIPVGRVYIDNDVSASTRSKKVRKDFEAMLAAVEAGAWSRVISYSNSRLTRRPLELERLITVHERTGILFTTVKSGTDDLSTADGRMVARIKAAVDAAEAERTGERVARAAQQRREDGRLHGGPRIFGYVHPNRADERPTQYCHVFDPPAVKGINDAIDMILSGAGKLTQVRDMWNERGLRTPSGKPWSNLFDIRRALISPRIAGLTAHGGVVTGVGTWPGIIDRPTHEAMTQALRVTRDHKGKTARKYLLPGYAYCVCGTPMVANVAANPEHGVNRYLCVKARGGCGQVSRNRPWLEAMVTAYVSARIVEEYAADEVVAGEQPDDDLEARIGEADAGIARLRDALAANLFTLDEVSEKIVPLREEIRQLRGQQADRATEAREITLETGDLLELWESEAPETLGERRAILARYVKRVMVKPVGKGASVPADSIEIIPVKRTAA